MNRGARPLRSTRRPSNLAGRPGWYSIQNAVGDGPAMVSIYDEIGFWGVAAADFMAELKTIPGDVQVNINSPGGDVWDGISIYNTLQQRPGKVHVIVDGLAASAASFIAQAASPGLLEMAPHSQMMIHDGFGMVIGNAADLRDTADLLDKTSDEIAGIYADRTGQPAQFWRDQMRGETWYTAKEAVAAGLADRVHGQADTPQDKWDLSVFSKFAGTGVQATATVVVNADGNHGPMSGSHSHSHPAYGSQGSDSMHSHDHSHDGDANHGHGHTAAASDKTGVVVNAGNGGWVQRDGGWVFDPDDDGDNDATAAGDSDHDYWSADGKQLKAIPPDPDGKQGKPLPTSDKATTPAGNQLVTSVTNADVDNTPWDASKAWHNGAESDDPAAFYKGICAGRKSGDPSTQDAWALPYKYTPSSAPNAAGVRNALSRLSSTQGLTNADQARSTLEGLMKKINPDYEPDDLIDPGLLSAALSLGLKGAVTV